MKVSLLLIIFLLLIVVINITAISILSFAISHPSYVKSLPQEYWGSSVYRRMKNKAFANSVYGFFSAVKVTISGKPVMYPVPPVPLNEKVEKSKEEKNEDH